MLSESGTAHKTHNNAQFGSSDQNGSVWLKLIASTLRLQFQLSIKKFKTRDEAAKIIFRPHKPQATLR